MSKSLQELKPRLLVHAMMAGALLFGDFTYKSGRKGPYFFNAANISDGEGLDLVADAYAAAIVESGIEFDVLFGTAYKGIPIAALVAAALFRNYGIKVGFAYNRKEVKDHGEGGSLVGASVKGQRVLDLDDVITAGKATQEAIAIIRAAGDESTVVVGVVLMFDRQERGKEDLSAVQEVSLEHGIPVICLFTLDDILAFVATFDTEVEGNRDFVSRVEQARQYIPAIHEYLEKYGVAT
jgi:orotate phosphoribosyltransferase